MPIRTLLILAALTAPAFAQTGGRNLQPPPSPVPPKPVVVATPAHETPKPKPKPRRRPTPPPDAAVAPGETLTPATPPATEIPAVEKPVPPPTAEKPAVEKPTLPPAVEKLVIEKPAPPPEVKHAPTRPISATAYTAKVKMTFSKRWANAVQPHMSEFQPGNVSVVFKLDADGKVAAFSVTENSSNESFAKFCEQFVRETPFDPPPAKALADGQFEVPFTFWIY